LKADFLPFLKCPKTNEHLKLTVETNKQVEVLIGKVNSSKFEYPIEDGVVNFIDPDNAYIQQEMMHNISDMELLKQKLSKEELDKYLKDQALGLDPPNYYDDYTRSTMDEIMGGLNLHNASVLEIGGSSGRDLMKYFGKANNTCVEMDINPHLGLVSEIIMNHHQVYYERVRADMNQLPFQDNQFDVVFGSATFHHIDDPTNCFKDIYRILKPGGAFYCLNERVLSSMAPEQKEVIAQEMEFSHEHAFFYSEWTAFLKNAGFSVQRVRPQYFTYEKLIERVYGNQKPQSMLGKLRYNYYKFMGSSSLNTDNPMLKVIQKLEDAYFANVPFNALCKKGK